MPVAKVTWPSYLPKPQIAGSSYESVDVHDYIETEDFEPAVNKRWRYHSMPYRCNALLSLNQAWNFEAFYQISLRDGLEWFFITLAIGGGFRQVEAHFVDGYSIGQVSQGYRTVQPSSKYLYRLEMNLEIKHIHLELPPWL